MVGTIELNEFLEIMSQFHVEPKPKRQVIDLRTNEPWHVPEAGILHLDFVDLHIPENHPDNSGSASNAIGRLIRTLEGNPAQAQMLQLVKHGTMRSQQQYRLYMT
jgi:hypothetical protein